MSQHEYKYVRCLFCTTGKEEAVARGIEASGHGRALFPQRDKRFLVGRAWVERPVALLPGYVFVYSDEERAVYRSFGAAQHIIRVLAYGGGDDRLTGRDREFADWLWRLQGRVGVLKALEVGDRIEIVDGAFKQLAGAHHEDGPAPPDGARRTGHERRDPAALAGVRDRRPRGRGRAAARHAAGRREGDGARSGRRRLKQKG